MRAGPRVMRAIDPDRMSYEVRLTKSRNFLPWEKKQARSRED